MPKRIVLDDLVTETAGNAGEVRVPLSEEAIEIFLTLLNVGDNIADGGRHWKGEERASLKDLKKEEWLEGQSLAKTPTGASIFVRHPRSIEKLCFLFLVFGDIRLC